MMKRTLRAMLCGAAAGGLIACGGGGGGGGGSDDGPSGNFSASDYQVTADLAAASVLASGSMDEQLEQALDDGGAAPSVHLHSIAGIRSFVLSTSAALPSDRERAQLTTSVSETSSCDHSGTLTIRMTFEVPLVIPPGFVLGRQAGDKVKVTADDCAFSPGDRPVNGGFTATFVSYVDDDDYKLSLSFDQFGTDILQLDGTVRVTSAGTTGSMTLAYRGLTATFEDSTVTWHHSVQTESGTAAQASFSGEFESTDGSTFDWVQTQPFVLSPATGYPASGMLTLRDAQGDRVQIVAGAEGFIYHFYTAGNTSSTPTATTQGRLYAD